MAIICPALLAKSPHDFKVQVDKVAGFARRVHIDLTDGIFSTAKTIELKKAWWPHGVAAELHMMYKRPDLYIDEILNLDPRLVIVHAEAEGNFLQLAETLHENSIQVGVALLPATKASLLKPALDSIDYVLVFAGKLGSFGGNANLDLISKVKLLKKLKPDLMIGWDGGVSDKNATLLVQAGVDVLCVGGYIQNAPDPQVAYATLNKIVEADTHDTKTDP